MPPEPLPVPPVPPPVSPPVPPPVSPPVPELPVSLPVPPPVSAVPLSVLGAVLGSLGATVPPLLAELDDELLGLVPDELIG
jgi:hypothetical protein